MMHEQKMNTTRHMKYINPAPKCLVLSRTTPIFKGMPPGRLELCAAIPQSTAASVLSPTPKLHKALDIVIKMRVAQAKHKRCESKARTHLLKNPQITMEMLLDKVVQQECEIERLNARLQTMHETFYRPE